DDGKNASPCLTQKAPYKGLGAESEEKREPASDIDAGVVNGLKVLDPDGRLEKRLCWLHAPSPTAIRRSPTPLGPSRATRLASSASSTRSRARRTMPRSQAAAN